MKDTLGELVANEIKYQSNVLVKASIPQIDSVNQKIKGLVNGVDRESNSIIEYLKSIKEQVKSVNIQEVFGKLIFWGFLCIFIGVFLTFFFVQFNGGMFVKRIYHKEIEVAEQRGEKQFCERITTEDSGLIDIYQLNIEYVKKHKSFYSNPDETIEYYKDKINGLKERLR